MKKLLLAVLLLLFLSASASAAFTITKMDYNGTTREMAMDFDSVGNPWLAYRSGGNYDLVVSHRIGSTWFLENPTGTTSTRSQGTDLLVDSSGVVHLSTRMPTTPPNTNHRLHYWERSAGGVWTSAVVDNNNDTIGGNSTIFQAGNGDFHIAYDAAVADDLKHARCSSSCTTASNWFTEIVDSNALSGSRWRNNIVVDSSNNPHIIYFGRNTLGSNSIKHARWTGSAWEIQEIGVTNAEFIDAVIDGSDQIHISYRDGSNDLKYGCYSGSWNLYSLNGLPGADNIDTSTSIYLNPSNQPRITYFAYLIDKVKLAGCQGCGATSCGNGTWSSRDVNTSVVPSTIDADSALYIDSSDNNYVAYQAGSVDFAEETSTLPEIPLVVLPVVVVIILISFFVIRSRRK